VGALLPMYGHSNRPSVGVELQLLQQATRLLLCPKHVRLMSVGMVPRPNSGCVQRGLE
jgi:hypothetical protein